MTYENGVPDLVERIEDHRKRMEHWEGRIKAVKSNGDNRPLDYEWLLMRSNREELRDLVQEAVDRGYHTSDVEVCLNGDRMIVNEYLQQFSEYHPKI